MRLSRQGLSLLLLNHVVELRFRRRILKEGYNIQRRMLCTNDKALLLSPQGQQILNYKPPTDKLLYNPAQKNLIPAWDIFMQNYRMVSCESVDVVAVIKSTPAVDFWKYFQEKIIPMNSLGKAEFMNN